MSILKLRKASPCAYLLLQKLTNWVNLRYPSRLPLLSPLLSLWMNGFTSFSIKPLRLSTYAGALTAFLGFIYALVIIIKHFVDSSIPEGWSSTMALQLVLGGIILVVLGLIGEYVGRIYMCINASPQFVERQVVKKTDSES